MESLCGMVYIYGYVCGLCNFTTLITVGWFTSSQGYAVHVSAVSVSLLWFQLPHLVIFMTWVFSLVLTIAVQAGNPGSPQLLR